MRGNLAQDSSQVLTQGGLGGLGIVAGDRVGDVRWLRPSSAGIGIERLSRRRRLRWDLDPLVHRPDRRMAAEVTDLAVEGVSRSCQASMSIRRGAFLGAQVSSIGSSTRRWRGSAETRTAVHSSASRMNWASLTAAGLMRATKVPIWGADFDQASSRRRPSASRIGGAADAEALAQLGLREAFARGQLGAYDLVAQAA